MEGSQDQTKIKLSEISLLGYKIPRMPSVQYQPKKSDDDEVRDRRRRPEWEAIAWYRGVTSEWVLTSNDPMLCCSSQNSS